MTVTAEAVKLLRERTGAGMMECKKALVEAGGDLEAAAEIMRKSGLAKADRKAGRVAAEGVIAIERAADGRSAAVVEVNSETDFVAREADFRSFAAAVAERRSPRARPISPPLPPSACPPGRRWRRRAVRSWLGSVRTSACGASSSSRATARSVATSTAPVSVRCRAVGRRRRLARDLAMHVAAINPQFVTAEDVPADQVTKEREIFLAQIAADPKAQGKPAEIVEKMVEGKVRKYWARSR